MKPIRRILVAVKNTRAQSLPAVTKAAQLAKAFGARIQLFHGISDRVYIDGGELLGMDLRQCEASERQERLEGLESLARGLRRKRIKVSTAAEWDFPAYEAILRNARKFGADLIVLDAHPGAHRPPWVLRFTDWELLRLSPIPVLIVKKRTPYDRPKVLAAIDPTHAFAKPARLDRQILGYGVLVADSLRGTLHAVHAYDPMPIGTAPSQFAGADALAGIQAQIARGAAQEVERTLGSTRIPPKRRHLIGRHPIDAIEEVAAEIGSSIVVMGAIGRSGLKRLLIGNTAQTVLDELPCDVLVVKPSQFRSDVGASPRGARIVPVAPPML